MNTFNTKEWDKEPDTELIERKEYIACFPPRNNFDLVVKFAIIEF